MSLQSGSLNWNEAEIVNALKITPDDVKPYFTDGRRISFILERRLAKEVFKGTLAPSEGAGFDLIDSSGGKWEVRSITSHGIYFCPSYMVGSGRSFDEAGFKDKLKSIEGYVVSDIESFPNVPFWILPYTIVEGWWEKGLLGTLAKISSRKKALQLINNLFK